MQCIRKLSIAIAFSTLAACASTAPVPELVAAAQPGPETPSTVSGPLLDTCIAGRSGKNTAISPAGAYNPSATYKFATKFYYGPKRMAQYAGRVRAYIVDMRGINIFGNATRHQLFCYYELQNGSLRFLASLLPDHEGRAEIGAVNSAVLTAYAIMAGKNVTKVKLFGVYAD